MASGILGRSNLSAGVNTAVYTVPASTFAVVSVSILNRSNNGVAIRLAVSDTSTPAAADWLEYDTTLDPKQVLERTGIVMQAGKVLVVYSSTANVNAVAFGIETSA